MTDFPNKWMWSEACEMLARAERLHREFFRPAASASLQPAWEPPVDVLETERAVLVLLALPGVDPDRVEAVIDEDCLVVVGLRVLPPELPRIFDAYYQAGAGRARGGSGLGLALARWVVERHGGTILAENRVGGGCRIVIGLPLVAEGEGQ